MNETVKNTIAPLRNVALLNELVYRVKNRDYGLPGMATFYGFPDTERRSRRFTRRTNTKPITSKSKAFGRRKSSALRFWEKWAFSPLTQFPT